MSFKTRQIRKRPPLRPIKKLKTASGMAYGYLSKTTPKQRSYIWGAFLVIVGIFIVLKVMTAAYNFVADFNIKSIFTTIGADLKKDKNGYTNIMLLGDGGHVRDGADLVDTIIVASIDYKKNAVSLLSIPRDYYVKDGALWPGKINGLYRNYKKQYEDENKLYEIFQTAGGEITGLDIQYYLRVNFSGFVDVVDALGGIVVDVKENISDPYYPNETDSGYTLFEIRKGMQEMDGETALKFARSRKTTSDFDRAFRQQQVIEAIREKALSLNILTSPSRLKKLYSAVLDNMNTNMSLGEMISLAGFAKNFDRSHLISKVIHDDPGRDGGFLYTPEKELYNGQFVLLPFGGNLNLIHKYADLIFNHREAFWNQPKIEVLSASKTSGAARNVAYQLNRFGFNITNVDNYYDAQGKKKYLDKSIIFYYNWQEDASHNVTPLYQAVLNALSGFIKTEAMPETKETFSADADISIILGGDYKDVFSGE
jgi:LCP family protein required for cell wall assembly